MVTSLIKILRDPEKEENNHYLAYSSQVLTKLNGWKSLTRGSDWDNQGCMDIKGGGFLFWGEYLEKKNFAVLLSLDIIF